MAAELLNPVARATDSNGRPYSGARWFFYASGTTTPQAVYADADLSVSLGATVTADSGGRFVPIYLDSDRVYRGVLKNASGSVTVADIDPINSTALSDFMAEIQAPPGAGLIGFSQAETYPDNTLGKHNQIFVSVTDAPFNAKGDGIADDTAAIQSAIDFVDGTGAVLFFPKGTYLVSQIWFKGARYTVETTSGVLFKALPATVTTGTILISDFEDLTFGDLKILGDIAGTSGEGTHGVHVAKGHRLRIGRIFGTNIRGDVCYCYARNTSDAERLRGVYIEGVSGTNIYRNLLTNVGGQVHVGSVIHAGPVGYRDFAVEPNDAGGTYEEVSLQIDYVRGGSCEITSDDAVVLNPTVRIGTYDADGDLVQNTTPPYPFHPGAGAYALGVSRTQLVKIGYFRAQRYDGWPINTSLAWGVLDIDTLDIGNCARVSNAFNSMIVQQGDAVDGACVRIGTLIMDAANTRYLARCQGAGRLRVIVDNIKLWKGLIGVGITGYIANGKIDINGSSGVALSNSTNVTFENIETLGYSSATFQNGCLSLASVNSSIFGTAMDGFDLPVGGAYRVAGTKVVSNQQPAIPNVSSSPSAAEHNAILVALRAHGLIAT